MLFLFYWEYGQTNESEQEGGGRLRKSELEGKSGQEKAETFWNSTFDGWRGFPGRRGVCEQEGGRGNQVDSLRGKAVNPYSAHMI